nr:hypothetical protein [Anaerobacillus isosaccharinicus]QOY37966.1 hypothetical protein AWH56_010580 [Anaerobacillus isosaccharinicus]
MKNMLKWIGKHEILAGFGFLILMAISLIVLVWFNIFIDVPDFRYFKLFG